MIRFFSRSVVRSVVYSRVHLFVRPGVHSSVGCALALVDTIRRERKFFMPMPPPRRQTRTPPRGSSPGASPWPWWPEEREGAEREEEMGDVVERVEDNKWKTSVSRVEPKTT